MAVIILIKCLPLLDRITQPSSNHAKSYGCVWNNNLTYAGRNRK